MKNFKKFIKLSIIALTVNIMMMASVAFSAPFASAAGLEPFNADKNNPDSLRFVFNIKAGESVADAARVTNSTNQSVNVEVLGRDGEITSDGQLTVVSNSLANQNAGKWISLDQNKYTIPASSAAKVPFKVTVPQGTNSGEYYAGLSVIELGDDTGTTTGNVTIKTRLAVKMFIIVQGSLNASTDTKSLNIIDPKDAEFNIEKAQYGKIGKDNLFVQYSAENTGNLFLKLNVKYTVTLPDGTTKEFSKDQDLAPNTGSKKYYLETGLPFQVGKTSVSMSYQANPLNKVQNASDLNSKNLSGTLTDTIELTQAEIDSFGQSRATQIQSAPKPADKPAPVEVKVVQESETNKLFLGTIIALLAGIIIIQLYTFIKKNKSKKEKKDISTESK